MKLAKSILCGVAALGFMAGPAIAGDDGQAFWNASPSSDMSYLLYGVDDDMDGRPDRYVVIEQSDTLVFGPSDADLENPYGG